MRACGIGLEAECQSYQCAHPCRVATKLAQARGLILEGLRCWAQVLNERGVLRRRLLKRADQGMEVADTLERLTWRQGDVADDVADLTHRGDDIAQRAS